MTLARFDMYVLNALLTFQFSMSRQNAHDPHDVGHIMVSSDATSSVSRSKLRPVKKFPTERQLTKSEQLPQSTQILRQSL